MDVTYGTTKLRELCESEELLQRRLGSASARKAKAHLASMQAAPTLSEFEHLPGRCRELDSTRAGELALQLPDGRELIFEPADPVASSEGLDWGAVKSVRILAIDGPDR